MNLSNREQPFSLFVTTPGSPALIILDIVLLYIIYYPISALLPLFAKKLNCKAKIMKPSVKFE